MVARFKIGDTVKVPNDLPDANPWWRGKEGKVRAVFEDSAMYEVLFSDAEDFDFVEEHMLAPAGEATSLLQSAP